MSAFRIGESEKIWLSAKTKQFILSVIVTIGVFSLGNVLCWTSPSLPDIREHMSLGNQSLTEEEESWVGSVAILGALFSSPIVGVSLDQLGRKSTMLISCPIFILGWLLISHSHHVNILLIGRFLTGFCAGAFSLAAPIYISEIAENDIRGALGSMFQIMLVLGVLFTYALGTVLNWSGLAFISAFVPGLALFLLPFIPETPRFLLRVGRKMEAGRTLHWLRNPESINQIQIELELLEIESSLDEIAEDNLKYFQLITSHYRLRPILICISLMIFEQLSGYNAIILYTEGIFRASGSNIDAGYSTVILGSVQVGSILVQTILVDRIGRRVLLLSSQITMGLSMCLLGTYFYLKEHQGQLFNDIGVMGYLKWVPLTGMIIFIVSFSVGIGPLSWTVMSELLPPNVKGVSSAIATFVVWICAFFVTKSFGSLLSSIGIYWCFWFFSICCFIGFGTIFWTVPETKGKSLAEIQRIFKSKKLNPPLSSRDYQKKFCNKSHQSNNNK